METYEKTQAVQSNMFQGINPLVGIWAGFWQRYYENSMRMMAIWMALPSDIMAVNKSVGNEGQHGQAAVRAYGDAVAETQKVMQDTADAAFEAGGKTKMRQAS